VDRVRECRSSNVSRLTPLRIVGRGFQVCWSAVAVTRHGAVNLLVQRRGPVPFMAEFVWAEIAIPVPKLPSIARKRP